MQIELSEESVLALWKVILTLTEDDLFKASVSIDEFHGPYLIFKALAEEVKLNGQ